MKSILKRNSGYFANICLFFYERGPPEHDPPQFGWVQCTSKNINIWLIVTFYFLKILKQIYFDKIILVNNILKLAFFTSFLISVRISGFLILIETPPH